MGVAAVVTDVLSFIDTGVASVLSLQPGLYYKSSPLSSVYMSYIAVRFLRCVLFVCVLALVAEIASRCEVGVECVFLRSG
jgi:hypothetical protein